ncbi:MAG: type II secretion system protein [bacterium]|nr:type II secretion system protein [bacterium]
MRSIPRHADGFTLLEVLMAVLVVGLVYGFLLRFVTQNLERVGDSRREIEVARLAEMKLRETQDRILSGEAVTPGVDAGFFEEPDEAYQYQVSIEPFSIPLPPSFKGEIAPSSVFTPTGQHDPARTPLFVVQSRVFREDDEVEQAIPFTSILTPPPPLAATPTGPAGSPRPQPAQATPPDPRQ